MENYNMSQEQGIALQVIKNNKLALLPYLDKINLATTLAHAITRDALAGRRSLVIIENEEIQKLLVSKIAEMQMSSIMLSLQEDDFFDANSLSKIRTTYKRKEQENDAEGLKLAHRVKANHHKIVDAFSTLTKKIFGDRSWIDLHSLEPKTEKIFTAESLDIQLELTQQEFWHLRGKIEEAKILYNFKTQVNDNILQKFNIHLESEDKIPDLKEHLIRFKVRLEDLQSKFDKEINRYKDKIWVKLEEEFLAINKVIEKIQLENILISKNAQKPKTGFIFNRKKDVNSDHFQVIQNQLNTLEDNILVHLPDIKITEEGAVETILNTLESQLAVWKKTGRKTIIRLLRSLNKNNSDSENLRNIDQEINVLYQEINDSGLFREHFENTSMNTMHQYKAIDTLLDQVKVLLSYIRENKDIVIWQSFLNQLTPSGKEIIKLLKKYETNVWIPLFEKWYLEKLIKKHSHPTINLLPDVLYQHQKIHQQWQEYWAKTVEYTLSEKRIKASKLCKTRNKKIYQKLFKKKDVQDLRVFDVIWNEHELLTYYFPIIIISAKLMRSSRLMKSGNWDQVYCEGTDIFKHVEKYNFLEQKICFFAPLSESFKVGSDLGIKMDDKQKSAKLLIHEYNYNQPIKELPISDKLKAAKKLAKIILSLNQGIRVFQLKNANILSLAGPAKNQELVNIYDDNGIKEIIPEDSLYETVTECILETNRDQYLIYQDHLLNINQYQSYLWQIEAIQDFASAGFQLINIPNVALRGDRDYFYHKVTKYIALDTHEKDKKSTAGK